MKQWHLYQNKIKPVEGYYSLCICEFLTSFTSCLVAIFTMHLPSTIVTSDLLLSTLPCCKALCWYLFLASN